MCIRDRCIIIVSRAWNPQALVTSANGTASDTSNKPAMTVKKVMIADATRLYQPTSNNADRVTGMASSLNTVLSSGKKAATISKAIATINKPKVKCTSWG